MVILDSVKSYLGIPSTVETFDDLLLDEINGAFHVLHQAGVGAEAYIITISSDWDDIVTPPKEVVKGFVNSFVRLAFDPPQNSFLVDLLKKRCDEYLWRITTEFDQLRGEEDENEE